MGKTVIIGAGPCGLYFALRLHQAGVNNILLVDPHAGEYVRPGHVNYRTIYKLENLLEKIFWDASTVGHIKDIERFLYGLVQQKNISVEKKSFVRFNQDPFATGVIIADEQQREEVISCSFVFDCTGSRRALVSEVNRLISPPPFILRPVAKSIKVDTHIIAYGLINRDTVGKINQYFTTRPSLTDDEYSGVYEQLRVFGWREFAMPFFYGTSFSDDKGCLYTEAPPDLPPEQKINWINCLIQITLKTSEILFHEMPPSKKYRQKPRIEYFTVNPLSLYPIDYQGKDLPRIIALGDAQLNMHYHSARGIRYGIARIELMMKHFTIHNQQIIDFATVNYLQYAKAVWKKHEDKIREDMQKRNNFLYESLIVAETRYQKIIAKTQDSASQKSLMLVFNEIRARILLIKVQSFWNNLKKGPISLRNEQDMLSLFDSLLFINQHLPSQFLRERQKNDTLAVDMAKAWKALGTAEFQKEEFINALDKYHRAWLLLNMIEPQNNVKELLILSSNKIICWLKQGNYSNVITEGIDQLTRCKTFHDPQILPTKQKILFNLVKSFRAIMETQPQALPLTKEIIADFIQQSLSGYAAPSMNNQLFSANQAEQTFIAETVAYLKAQHLYTEPMNLDDKKTGNRLQM